MVISFANSTAFEHLDEHGSVVTARPRKRAHPNPNPSPEEAADSPEEFQETWLNRGRGQKGVLDVRIEPGDPFEWEPHEGNHPQAEESGFGDSDGWRRAIRETHGELREKVFVYKVVKTGDRREEK